MDISILGLDFEKSASTLITLQKQKKTESIDWISGILFDC